MKHLYYTFCLTAICAFVWFAAGCYQKATSMTLAEFIDRQIEQHTTEKMEQLYAGAYEN